MKNVFAYTARSTRRNYRIEMEVKELSGGAYTCSAKIYLGRTLKADGLFREPFRADSVESARAMAESLLASAIEHQSDVLK